MTTEQMKAKVAELNQAIGEKNAELDEHRAKLRADILALSAERDGLVCQLDARKDLDAMSPAKRKAMAGLIQPEGIPSGEAVGNLGAQ